MKSKYVIFNWITILTYILCAIVWGLIKKYWLKISGDSIERWAYGMFMFIFGSCFTDWFVRREYIKKEK
jgi:hypothetical protein